MNIESTTVANRRKKAYASPRLETAGTLAALTQGFAGSVPDEQGGQTKRNPFQG
ncbi:hypothetical protein R0135_03765 [Congregibacter variabilis]|uniref:RiPP n=1 Tax=Congregibacter variabilis TaxID=3081200 RepID=A0ABZ0I504_9GAMM|nr:hypothetical protein R0135_03765 [Congregibacter sp. IMCC43200]